MPDMPETISLPHAVREIENVFIPLSDGTSSPHASGCRWMPRPIPCRRSWNICPIASATARRRAMPRPIPSSPAMAMPAVRVDIRGTGESDGVLLDEYLKLEQDDCLEVLEWLEAQPWCTGACGMIGISWGGFNGLQVAARRPPAAEGGDHPLLHRRPLCRRRPLHGRLHARRQFRLGLHHVHPQSYAPDPALVGERWREMWLERLENQPLLVDNWLQHQRRDAFWKHGSVCENYADITAAVYAVGGWADGYTMPSRGCWPGSNARRRGWSAPGPIAIPSRPSRPRHRLPAGMPALVGPVAEGQGDRDHGRARLSRLDGGLCAAGELCAEQPGRWVAEPAWPSKNIKTMPLAFNAGRLGPSPEDEAALPIRSPRASGCSVAIGAPMARRRTCPRTSGRRMPARSSSTWRRWGRRLEILGAPEVELELSADRPQAQICVRLNDVAPDGASLRVSFGLLNLTHRDSHERSHALGARQALSGQGEAERCGPCLPQGPSHPHRDLQLLLAHRLALAGDGGPHPLHRGTAA